MSIEAMLWAFKQSLDRSAEKLVLLELSNHAGTDNTAWPSLVRICNQTGLNRKTVISALDGLEEKQLIRDTGERKGASLQIKVYRLSLRGLNETVPETVSSSETVPFLPETVPFLPSDSTENGTRNLLLNLKESIKHNTLAQQSFATFWDAYPKHPRKQAKSKCFDMWKRRGCEHKLDLILKHLEFSKGEWLKEGNKYVPMTSSYINAEGWDGWEHEEEKSQWVNS
jgi:hypothetical protein